MAEKRLFGDTTSITDIEEARQLVENELARFETFYASPASEGGLGNDRMLPFEKALLRTFLIARARNMF